MAGIGLDTLGAVWLVNTEGRQESSPKLLSSLIRERPSGDGASAAVVTVGARFRVWSVRYCFGGTNSKPYVGARAIIFCISLYGVSTGGGNVIEGAGTRSPARIRPA